MLAQDLPNHEIAANEAGAAGDQYRFVHRHK
jgi:hypothetical protein